jgi:hypothetical protein
MAADGGERHQPMLRRAVRRHSATRQQRAPLPAEGVELLELGGGGRGDRLLLDDVPQQVGVDAEGRDLHHDVPAAVVHAEEAAPPELVLEAEHSLAAGEEVAGVPG